MYHQTYISPEKSRRLPSGGGGGAVKVRGGQGEVGLLLCWPCSSPGGHNHVRASLRACASVPRRQPRGVRRVHAARMGREHGRPEVSER